MATRIELSEQDAQAVLLVQAFEEADGDGLVLPYRERKTAEAAEGEREDVGARLKTRARRLLSALDDAVPSLPTLRRVTRLGVGLGPAVFIVAFLLGLSTAVLGPERQINLLSFPMLGLLAWNLGAYLVFTLVWLLKGKAGGPPGSGLARTIAPVVTLGYLKRTVERLAAHEPAAAKVVRRALSAYLNAWRPAAAPLVLARSRRLLHLGALAAMAGVVGSMYLRGLAFSYSVTWESTFLDEGQVQTLLGWVLAPALTLLGRELPPLDGPADVWIHLFALTAGLLVILPRGLLVLTETLRIARLSRRLPLKLEGAYFRKILAAGRGDRLRIVVLPYSRSLPRRHGEKLQTALLDLYGSRALLRQRDALEYGDDPLPLLEEEGGESLATQTVVVFNLAQTPEAEVHGEVMEALAGAGETPLAVVDGAAYRERLGESSEAPRRLEERRRAWQRVLAGDDGGAPVAHVDLAAMEAEALLAALTAAQEGKAEVG